MQSSTHSDRVDEFKSRMQSQFRSHSPRALIDTLFHEGKKLFVIRDDLLLGGTKQRAAVPYLLDYQENGVEEFVYASPFCGFAQVALASACQMVGARCAIFAERDPALQGNFVHELSLLAKNLGAKVVVCEGLQEAELNSVMYAASQSRATKIPLGFDDLIFQRYLTETIEEELNHIFESSRGEIQNFWLPLGSGTLVKAFRKILPSKTIINCVDVHVLPKSDQRIQNVISLGNVVYYSAAEIFAQRAESIPPIPSNMYYDAKLWTFINSKAQNGDVWWNVAR
jgi:hypothetical protein